MLRLCNSIPVKPRGRKSCDRIRVGDLLARRRVVGLRRELCKMSELFSPARRNRRGQVLPKIAEKEKWCFRSEFFAHEEQRWGRGEQQYCQHGAHRAWICNFGDTFAEGAVSDLIMVLQEGDKRSQRQASRGFATGLAILVTVTLRPGSRIRRPGNGPTIPADALHSLSNNRPAHR